MASPKPLPIQPYRWCLYCQVCCQEISLNRGLSWEEIQPSKNSSQCKSRRNTYRKKRHDRGMLHARKMSKHISASSCVFGSMYGIFTCLTCILRVYATRCFFKNRPDVFKYAIDGSYGFMQCQDILYMPVFFSLAYFYQFLLGSSSTKRTQRNTSMSLGNPKWFEPRKRSGGFD